MLGRDYKVKYAHQQTRFRYPSQRNGLGTQWKLNQYGFQIQLNSLFNSAPDSTRLARITVENFQSRVLTDVQSYTRRPVSGKTISITNKDRFPANKLGLLGKRQPTYSVYLKDSLGTQRDQKNNSLEWCC